MAFSAAIAVVLALAAGQATPRSYAGTWIAEFEGREFARIVLAVTGDTLAGTLAIGDIEFNEAGEVRKAGPLPTRPSEIIDVLVRDSSLSFVVKNGADMDHFEMSHASDGTQLRFLPSDEDRRELAAAGVPTMKPIRLKRLEPRQ